MKPRPLSTKKTKYIYESKADGWGVVNKTKTTGQDRVYDKEVELKLHQVDEKLSQEGGACFRFETQLERDRIDQFGLRTLSKINDENVWAAINERWHACRWDVTVNEPGTAKTAMVNLTPSEKSGLIAYLGKHQLGLEDEITESGHRKYRTMAKSLGFVPGKPLESQGKATRKASISEGRLVDLA